MIASGGGGIGIAGSTDVHIGRLEGTLQQQEGPYRFAQITFKFATAVAIDTNDYSDFYTPFDTTGLTGGLGPGAPYGLMLGAAGAEVWSVQGVIQSVREWFEGTVD